MWNCGWCSDVAAPAVLAAAILFPSIGYVWLDGTSYAGGTVGACLFAAVIYLALERPQLPRFFAFAPSDRMALIFGIAFVLQSAAAYGVAGQFHGLRFWGSLGALTILAAGAASMSALLARASDMAVRRTLFWFAGGLMLMVFADALGWRPITDARFNRPLFVFAEPSHFALVLAPFLLWVVVSYQSIAARVAIFALAFLVLLLVKNMTLFLLVGLASLVVLPARALLLSLCGLLLIIASDTDYFLPRLDLTAASSNLSALVWLQGWQEAMIGVRETLGIGLGFQQLGVDGAKGAISHQIAALLWNGFGTRNGTLNLLDGGTLGAKLVGEFGILGIALVALCSYAIVGGIRNLRKIAANGVAEAAATTFFYCCMVSLSLALFVRGTGYFAPSVLLSLIGFLGLRYVNETSYSPWTARESAGDSLMGE